MLNRQLYIFGDRFICKLQTQERIKRKKWLYVIEYIINDIIILLYSSQRYEERKVEIQLHENNSNDNNDIYKHSRLFNNPNEYNEKMKSVTGFEDGGIVEKKKKQNNNDINTNFEMNENNISIGNIEKVNENEEKIDDDIPYISKISGIKNENDINNINNENNLDDEREQKNNEENINYDEGNNGLIIDEEDNFTSKKGNINNHKNNEGMSEKDY